MTATVLVTDGEQRASLAIVRSLGRAGHRPYVCSARARSLAGASRYAVGEARVPDPLAEPSAYAEAIAKLVSRWKVDLILPVTDPALLTLLGRRDRLGAAVLPFASLEQFRNISDKARLLKTAAGVGIAIPEQCVLASPADRGSLAAEATPKGEGLKFPLVLKPATSIGEWEGRRMKLTVEHVADQAELDRAVERLPPAAYPLLVQQRIVGPGVGIFLLLWDQETVALFAHRRIREKPPAGGVSVYRESIAADPSLVEKSRALLSCFGWRGVAMIEYKLDAASGTPYLMEVNGRFWGSLQLAIDAGVDFPALLVAVARGERPAPVTRYRVGVRSRWWWGDVDQLLARLRRSNAELSLPPGDAGRLRALGEFLKLWRPGDRNEIFRWTDPMPLWRESIEWLHRR